MFLEELQPILQEFLRQPLAFAGGVVSGALGLKMTEDPLKSWLQQQGVTNYTYTNSTTDNGSGPQSISID